MKLPVIEQNHKEGQVVSAELTLVHGMHKAVQHAAELLTAVGLKETSLNVDVCKFHAADGSLAVYTHPQLHVSAEQVWATAYQLDGSEVRTAAVPLAVITAIH